MFKNVLVVNITLVLIALLWGMGFVPQRLGMNYMDAYAFNGMRFSFGAITLLPVLFAYGLLNKRELFNKSTAMMGCCLGLLLFGGASFQQIGIKYTSLANVAFITGLYAIIVPVLGYFIGYRYRKTAWFGGMMAIVGLYCMTGASGQFSFKGDVFVLFSALFWAVHLLLLSQVVIKHQALVLALYQFIVCAVCSIVMALVFENGMQPSADMGYVWAALNGVLVVGIAYTLHIMVMEKAEPFLASLVLSLEAVFGALAGYLFFHEIIGVTGLIGAALMFAGCLLAQFSQEQ